MSSQRPEDAFVNNLKKAKANGDQPDLNTVDIHELEAKVCSGKLDEQDLPDSPVGGKVETVKIRAFRLTSKK